MKPLKTLGVVLGVVVLLAIGGVMIVVASIDSIAERAVEREGTRALGVDTTLGGVDIGLFSGRIGLDDLEIDNPEGFTSGYFMQLDNGELEVSLGSLRSDTVRAPLLALTGLRANFDNLQGDSNLDTILDNLKKLESGASKPADPNAKPGKGFVIERLVIRDILVNVEYTPAGGDLTRVGVPIPLIELTDVGADKPLPIADLTGVVLKAVLVAVIEHAGTALPEFVLGTLQGGLDQLAPLAEMGIGLTSDVGEITTEVLGGAADAAGKAAEDIGDAAGDAVRGAGDAVRGAGDAIGGLLGGGNKDKKQDEAPEGQP